MLDELKRKLDAHYDEIIARLRIIAPKETAELLGVIAAREGALATIKPHPDSSALPYVYFDSVIEAILDWFKTRDNRAATEDEIRDGVLNGGLQLHSPRRELNVVDSIDFHTNPKRNKGHGRLQKTGKLIKPK
jgi:hypothetical protein